MHSFFVTFIFHLHSQKRQTFRQSSRCCQTQSLPQTSLESGRRPMFPWCRRSVLKRTSRWHQTPRKLQHQSLLLRWRPVYRDSSGHTLLSHTCGLYMLFNYTYLEHEELFCFLFFFSQWRRSSHYMISRSH